MRSQSGGDRKGDDALASIFWLFYFVDSLTTQNPSSLNCWDWLRHPHDPECRIGNGWMDHQINFKLTNPVLPLKSLSPFSLFVISMTDVQFNYMHECFERVFCELKWRKEVRINLLLYYKPFICAPKSYLHVFFVFLQVEEEATDKDNKNCSKDGMCGKVKRCLPLSILQCSDCTRLCVVLLTVVSVAEYFPAAETQKGWRHLGREIVTS